MNSFTHTFKFFNINSPATAVNKQYCTYCVINISDFLFMLNDSLWVGDIISLINFE